MTGPPERRPIATASTALALPALFLALATGAAFSGCRSPDVPAGGGRFDVGHAAGPQPREDGGNAATQPLEADAQGKAPGVPRTPEAWNTGHVMVEPATFLRLTPGMTWTEAVALLGTTGRHGFTYRREDKTYVLTTCFVRNRPETESGIAFHCLFEDGVLARVLRSLPKNLEEYPYKGTTATRRKTWRVDDEQWILTILSLPGETRNAVARILEEYADPRPRNESNLPPWVFKILAPAYVARVRRGYERNAELLRRFDGHKIAIGMTKDEVDGLLGLPVHVEPTPSGKVLSIYSRKIYGKDREEKLEINPYFRFSPVAVVFDDGKACRVYSAGFISRDWMPDGEEYGL